MKRLFVLLIVLFSVLCNIQAQQETVEDIRKEFTADTARLEQQVRDMLDKNWSTMGMIAAGIELKEGYDKLLNKYYKLLYSKLDEKGKKALTETQRNWIKMRDSEQELLNNVRRIAQEEAGGGSIWGILHANASAEITRKRVFVLVSYLLFDDLREN